MFLPNTTCYIYSRTDTTNIFGKYEFLPRKTVKCSVITYDIKSLKTSVRADTSATRGQAENDEGIAKFCFPTYVNLKLDDEVEKDGFRMKVIEIHPRRNVLGKLDHYEVDMKKVEEE